MGEQYRGGQTSIGSIEFSERTKYLNFLRSLGFQLLDTHDRNRLFGLLNNKYQIVMPNAPDPLGFGEYAEDVPALNFVRTQFDKFKEYYNNANSASGITPPELVSNLIPSKSLISFEGDFSSYENVVVNIVLEEINRRHNNRGSILFDKFSEYFTDSIFIESMKNLPVTKTGFAISQHCDIFTTGLYVDLGADYSPHLDELKVQIISDPGFPCYIEYANKFGFLVDAHNPWRLVANIQSLPMQENIMNGRPTPRFNDFYNNEYLFKVAINGGGSGGDYEVIKSLYERCYIEYHRRYVNDSSANQAQIPGKSLDYWLDILIINKLREFGVIYQNPKTSISEFSGQAEYESLLGEAKVRLETSSLTSVSGAEAYLMTYFASLLRRKMREG